MAVARRPRIFKVRRDCLGEYSDFELVQRFRLNREGITYVCNLIKDDVAPATGRNKAISAMTKTLITLRYLATGRMQLCSADHFGVSQPTVSRVISEVLDMLSAPELIRRFIKFPTSVHDVRVKQQDLYSIATFPGIVGVIDGTHIQIQAPSHNEPEYVNRHHYHSINVQVVFDGDYNIIDLVAKWPGATHDARILNESGLKTLFESNSVPGNAHLLGDSGYPAKRWLLTPFLRPATPAEMAYNRAHKRTRAVVERGIGQWKRRFHVLHSEIRLSPQKACKIVIACGVLHQICKARGIPLPDDDIVAQHHNQDDDDDLDDGRANIPGEGAAYRRHVVHSFFQWSR